MSRPKKAALQGTLEDTSVPDIMHEIYTKKMTGVLGLTRPGVEKQLYIRKGRILFARSNHPNDRLGERCLLNGVITWEALEEASHKLGKGKRLGAILVGMNCITAHQLVNAVKEQVEDIALSVFEWTDGTYRFTVGPPPIREIITMNISTPDIILRGVKRIISWTRISKGVGGLNLVYALAPNWEKVADRCSLLQQEEVILLAMKDPLTMRQLLRLQLLPDVEVCRLIWAARVLGIVDVVDTKKLAKDGQPLKIQVAPGEAVATGDEVLDQLVGEVAAAQRQEAEAAGVDLAEPEPERKAEEEVFTAPAEEEAPTPPRAVAEPAPPAPAPAEPPPEEAAEEPPELPLEIPDIPAPPEEPAAPAPDAAPEGALPPPVGAPPASTEEAFPPPPEEPGELPDLPAPAAAGPSVTEEALAAPIPDMPEETPPSPVEPAAEPEPPELPLEIPASPAEPAEEPDAPPPLPLEVPDIPAPPPAAPELEIEVEPPAAEPAAPVPEIPEEPPAPVESPEAPVAPPPPPPPLETPEAPGELEPGEAAPAEAPEPVPAEEPAPPPPEEPPALSEPPDAVPAAPPPDVGMGDLGAGAVGADISFSDLEGLSDLGGGAPPGEGGPADETRAALAAFNAKQRYLFDSMKRELGSSVANFFDNCRKKTAEQYADLFADVEQDGDGRLDEEQLLVNINRKGLENWSEGLADLLETQLEAVGQMGSHILGQVQDGLETLE